MSSKPTSRSRKIDTTRLKKIVSGALGKSLADAGHAERPRTVRNADSRVAVARALASTLEPSTVKKFAAIAERDQAKLAARLAKFKAVAVRASRGRQQALTVAAAKYLANVKGASQLPIDPGQIGHVLLNVPFMISPGRDTALDQSQIVANNSFAKFRGRAEDDDD